MKLNLLFASCIVRCVGVPHVRVYALQRRLFYLLNKRNEKVDKERKMINFSIFCASSGVVVKRAKRTRNQSLFSSTISTGIASNAYSTYHGRMINELGISRYPALVIHAYPAAFCL